MIEQNPGLVETTRYSFEQIDTFAGSAETIRDFVRAGLKHGAEILKGGSDQWFTAKLMWGPVKLHINARRDEVCERVVVDTREIVEEIPDPEQVAKLPKVKQTRVEEIVEWKCSPILADDTQKASV
jgi:hypothetical protein